MAITELLVQSTLKVCVDPNTGKDFVTSKALKNLQIQGGDVSFDVELGYPAKSQIPGFRKALIAAAKGVRPQVKLLDEGGEEIKLPGSELSVNITFQLGSIITVKDGKFVPAQ